MTGYRSSLARATSSRPEPEMVKREGWQETGILVIHPEDARLDVVEREIVQRIGNRLYGKREAADTGHGPASNVRRLQR